MKEQIDIQVLYSAYSNGDVDLHDFKNVAIDLIDLSAGKKETKLRFYRIVANCSTKDKVLKSVNNYFLSGQGLKVV